MYFDFSKFNIPIMSDIKIVSRYNPLQDDVNPST